LVCVFISAAFAVRVAFIGNSLTGGGGVGGNPGSGCEVLWPQPQPSPPHHRAGDVPTKVRTLADLAGVQWSWEQNTRSSYFLHDHASDCKEVNKNLVMDADVVVLQAQSTELQLDTCTPSVQQVTDANILFAPAPSEARLYLVETWAYYNYSENDWKFERCFSEQVRCATATLASKLQRPVRIVPMGLAYRLLSDAVCLQKVNPTVQCAQEVLDFAGYSISSCNVAVWSLSGSGVFAAADIKHQSEAAGAWLCALVMYGTLEACMPPSSWLDSLDIPLAAELTAAARAALDVQFGDGLPECDTVFPH